MTTNKENEFSSRRARRDAVEKQRRNCKHAWQFLHHTAEGTTFRCPKCKKTMTRTEAQQYNDSRLAIRNKIRAARNKRK